MLLGARFVCVSCRLRGASRRCPRCDRPRLDLGTPGDVETLLREWRMAHLWRQGVGFVSPRSIPRARGVLVLTALVTVAALCAPMVGAVQHGAGLGEIVLSGLGGLVLAPFVAAFFAVFLFYWAHLLRLSAMLLWFIASLLPFGLGSARRTVADWIVWLVEASLLPRIALDPASIARTPMEGTVDAPLRFSHVRDGMGWMERADAWLPPFELQTPSGPTRVVPEHGTLVFSMAYYRAQAARRAAPSAGAPPNDVPAWADGHGRTRGATREIDAGARVEVWGGEQRSDGWYGTPEAPIHLRIT